jgi:hypothetical protein
MSIVTIEEKKKEHAGYKVHFYTKVHIIMDDDDTISHISVDILNTDLNDSCEQTQQHNQDRSESKLSSLVLQFKEKIFGRLFQSSTAAVAAASSLKKTPRRNSIMPFHVSEKL